MNAYDSLVGQAFSRNGVRYTVVRVSGATVVAALLRNGRVERVFVPLAEVLDNLEVTQIQVTQLPREPSVGRGTVAVSPPGRTA
ncbi:MAG: hypothetical protein GVY21_07935 [Gammaproteobacteria bacterium]|jgi:hypothetical protein|nr:hypothetical protein [Gammaproteobacteria bacterium]